MRHPKLCNWILFRKAPDGRYFVKDCSYGQEYSFSRDMADFAQKLDGKTDPYSMPEGYPRLQVYEMLKELEEMKMLRRGRLIKQGPGSYRYTVVMPVKYIRRSRTAAVLDALLSVLWEQVRCNLRSWHSLRFLEWWHCCRCAAAGNPCVFVLVFLTSVPLNITLVRWLFTESLFENSFLLTNILRGILLFIVAVSTEELICLLLARRIWKRQYRLTLTKDIEEN